jgi:DNA-binding MltR family transcriptional regulator
MECRWSSLTAVAMRRKAKVSKSKQSRTVLRLISKLKLDK